jgi:serine/threonine-protein kinase
MGEVYLADHLFIARRAALKFLLPELSSAGDVVNRFFVEARAASMIRHPGIVEVLDCQVDESGRAYIVMEALTGESLVAYLQRIPRLDADLPAALGIATELASALAAAHAQGIVHRDLKPDNVFLHVGEAGDPRSPTLKILDFGIAKLVGAPSPSGSTLPGLLLGTPLYMSPEQCRGTGLIDLRSDIYTFGCILFRLLCGRTPFTDQGVGDLIIAHTSSPPPDPLALSPGLPPWLGQLVFDCLAKAPSARPQTMNDVLERLAAAHSPTRIVLRTPIEVPPRPDPRAAQPTPLPAVPTPRGARLGTPVPVGATMPLPVEVEAAQAPASQSQRNKKSGKGADTLQRVAAEVVRERPQSTGASRIVLIIVGVALAGAAAAALLWWRGGKDLATATSAESSVVPSPAPVAPPAQVTLPAPPESKPPSRIEETKVDGELPVAHEAPTRAPHKKKEKGHDVGARRKGKGKFDGFDDL